MLLLLDLYLSLAVKYRSNIHTADKLAILAFHCGQGHRFRVRHVTIAASLLAQTSAFILLTSALSDREDVCLQLAMEYELREA